MNYYQLTIAYDGTNYQGWHEQPHKKTVKDTILDRFKAVFGVDTYLVGASRTDAGVHALGQIALIKTSLDLSASALKKAWNDKLPSDIVIRSIAKTDSSFHPQSHVLQKTYWYHVFPQRPLPFVSRYGLFYKRTFNVEKLKNILNVFIGTHDFRSFCSSDYQKDTVRTIDDIQLIYIKRYNVYRIEVYGQRFLYNMIRRIVGASLYVASRQHLGEKNIRDALNAKKSEQTLPNAPSLGLLLYKIVYAK